jgi:hypothetical protein
LCAKAVSKGTVREHEVTRLLMANRFFTQSCRMLVLSMQALTARPSVSEDVARPEKMDSMQKITPQGEKLKAERNEL